VLPALTVMVVAALHPRAPQVGATNSHPRRLLRATSPAARPTTGRAASPPAGGTRLG
jgi:hypothetical protein